MRDGADIELGIRDGESEKQLDDEEKEILEEVRETWMQIGKVISKCIPVAQSETPSHCQHSADKLLRNIERISSVERVLLPYKKFHASHLVTKENEDLRIL